MAQYIPASGIIIDRKKGKVHIVNPGKPRLLNISQGFYDASGFHPIRSSSDYDPDRAGDEYSDTGRRKKRKPAKKAKARPKKRTAKKGRKR